MRAVFVLGGIGVAMVACAVMSFGDAVWLLPVVAGACLAVVYAAGACLARGMRQEAAQRERSLRRKAARRSVVVERGVAVLAGRRDPVA